MFFSNCCSGAMKLFAVLIALCFCISQTNARRYSPLLVEDDGFRRNNRPAGKFYAINIYCIRRVLFSVVGFFLYFDFFFLYFRSSAVSSLFWSPVCVLCALAKVVAPPPLVRPPFALSFSLSHHYAFLTWFYTSMRCAYDL